ncbi:Uncharacterised protein [Bordetella pertussis]|nr:Uncharacterised protein [Bordetella pertussis]CFU03733.1 Uncharacterised protein [Bordetella pertussis]
MAPPAVLPTVATSTVGQNISGASLTNPYTAASDPSGNRVADSRLTRKTALRPTLGRARRASSQ